MGEQPLDLQAKLLRAIQVKEFERLSSNKTIHTDVCIIAYTNRDLEVSHFIEKFAKKARPKTVATGDSLEDFRVKTHEENEREYRLQVVKK